MASASPLPSIHWSPFAASHLTPAQRQKAFSLIVAGSFIFLFTLARLALRRSTSLTPPHLRKSSSTTKVLLTGPSGAGKTRIWARLVLGKDLETVPSMEDNIGVVDPAAHQSKDTILDDKQHMIPVLQVIDTPGHATLRGRSLATHAASANGIVFVVPSTSLAGPALREAGEYLHLLLTQLAILSHHHQSSSSASPPLLVLITISKVQTSATPARSTTSLAVLERAKASLIRELARRRSLPSSYSVSTSQQATGLPGAKLQGLGPVPMGTDTRPWWKKFLAFERELVGECDKKGNILASDEGEVLTRHGELGLKNVQLDGDDGWNGGVRWVVWDASDAVEDKESLQDVRDWIAGL